MKTKLDVMGRLSDRRTARKERERPSKVGSAIFGPGASVSVDRSPGGEFLSMTVTVDHPKWSREADRRRAERQLEGLLDSRLIANWDDDAGRVTFVTGVGQALSYGTKERPVNEAWLEGRDESDGGLTLMLSHTSHSRVLPFQPIPLRAVSEAKTVLDTIGLKATAEIPTADFDYFDLMPVPIVKRGQRSRWSTQVVVVVAAATLLIGACLTIAARRGRR